MIRERHLTVDGNDMSYCKISRDNDNTWTISEWFTNKHHLHQGYGKQVLSSLLSDMYDEFGRPRSIRYIWNGANDYVMDWLNKFDPVCLLPVAIMKYSEADKWEAHVYTLDTDKLLQYALKEKKS